jgi:glyoxylase-like metal-dependent hydrolase (beta-lactamase superfamily II)
MIPFRQIFAPDAHAFTYLLWDSVTREAAVIDAVAEPASLILLLALLREFDLRLCYLLQTHTHDDTTRFTDALCERTGATVVSSVAGTSRHGVSVRHGDTIALGGEAIAVIGTSGHTAGCLSYLWRDRVFTGDALLPGGCGCTDLPGASAAALYDSIVCRLFTLPDETLVFPAHDHHGRTVSTIAEERECNPALAGCSRDEFISRRSPP